ncbi:MAG: hypothetical protein COT80_01320 [Candidatus Buchananbacteria bacterium CG10_big_fil_rev_8_21_14_0_10_33_19]|uniref:Transglycosylase SLT domain-containing protein n=1 Tax=Candidatus Buchananbacteria bacterium CG10_big_fil_rev_8_21_14_0_10_33_19 TaxID=1974525 RepID=A0A2H0W4B8_9BACT|nr:MAG: hypothetical protein COT80_01320 [Candidatus Buchananbacteria bacterium CG10_big_fil_rev_8_21_14_0_10_33_19]
MYINTFKRKIFLVYGITLILLLALNPYSMAMSGDQREQSSNYPSDNENKNNFLSDSFLTDKLFKLFGVTTLDPEIELALDASYIIESDSGKNLIGDDGRSIGPLHIQKQAIDDVNRILGYKAFTYSDRMSLEESCKVFKAYLDFYGQRYFKKTGKQPTTEVYVRIWNGGPNGYQSVKTKNHWQKAKEVIF